MKTTSFETIVFSAEFYKNCIKFAVKSTVVIIILLILLMVIVHYSKSNIHIPIMWFINYPKIYICLMTIVLIFFYDYDTGKMKLTDFNNMSYSTFLVGILALIDILTAIASVVKDMCDLFNEYKNDKL